jgi:hypothetical protein
MIAEAFSIKKLSRHFVQRSEDRGQVFGFSKLAGIGFIHESDSSPANSEKPIT